MFNSNFLYCFNEGERERKLLNVNYDIAYESQYFRKINTHIHVHFHLFICRCILKEKRLRGVEEM